MHRRHFLSASSASIGGAMAAAPSTGLAKTQTAGIRLPLRKGILLGMLPGTLSIAERFALARECGFESMECGTEDDLKVAEEIKAASEKSGLPIHSVMNRDHWKYPLSSPDASVVARSVQGMETSLRNAKLWGADTVLLVPAVVTPEVSYKEAWDRSTEQVRKMIPLAEKLKIVIAIEEVWNKFLLSPLEFAAYVDQFKSPWVKAYFDVGNMVLYGFPQDWIRTLGKRIVKIHFKDFSFRNNPQLKKRVADFVNLREGDIDWKAVHKALADVGYKGDATVELSGGNAEYLKDLSHRVNLILQGE